MKTTDTIPKKCSSLRVASKYTTLAVALGAWLAGSIALAAPANDNFTDAINLTGVASGQTGDALVGSQTGTNSTDATLESGEPTIAGTTKSVWFKWTCPASGNLTVDTLGSTNPAAGEWDAVLGIYTGSAVNALTPLGGSPQDIVLQEAMTVAVTAGTVYSIQLGGYNDEVAANILLRWNLVPTNGASILSFGPGAVVGSVVSNAASIAWIVPYGSPTAPTFTLSPGATCTIGGLPVTSGSPVNFTGGPVVFTITAQGASPIINNYTVTVSSAPAVLWDTAGDGVWDQVTSNWFTQPGAVTTTFANGNEAIFSDIVGGTVNIAPAGVSPGLTTVNAAEGSYIFTGGPIAGNGALTKSGDSSLTLSTPNTYLGATAVNGGTLTANGTGAVGGSTSFSVATDATLLLSGSTGAKKTWPETAAALSGAGTVTVPGSGLIGVGFKFDMSTFTGNLNLNGGQFTVSPAVSPGFVSPVNGTINVGSGTCLYLGWTGYVMNATVRLNTGIDNGENLGVLRASVGTLNGALILGANTKIGADPTLIINAVISDEGNGFGFTQVANGTVTLTATNTYTGPTIINSGATLKCDTSGSLGSGDLRILGKVNLNYVGTRSVTALTLGGVSQIGGTYGSTASDATYKNDTYFSGTGTVTAPPSSANNILTFNFGVHGAATIFDDTIIIDVLYGTDLTTLAPTYTVSPAASGSPASGATVDFSLPDRPYTITAQDGTTKEYFVSVIESPPSSASDITAFGTNVPGSSAQFVNTGETTGTIIWTVPAGTVVADLAPSYTLSPGATCTRPNPGVPTPAFSTATPVSYLVTAQDAVTTKNYSVIVIVATPPPVVSGLRLWLDASQLTGLTDGQQVDTWLDKSGLTGNDAIRAAGSPKYKVNALSGKPVVRFDNASSFTTPNLASQFPTGATVFIMTTVSNDAAYTLINTISGADEWWRWDGNGRSYSALFRSSRVESYTDMPSNGSHVFSVSSAATGWQMWINGTGRGVVTGAYSAGGVQTIGNNSNNRFLNGDIAEVIEYDRVLTDAERRSVEAYLTNKWLLNPASAIITSFGPGAEVGPLIGDAADIFWTVPYGTNVAALPATFTLSPGATCTKISGATQDFTSPVVYSVTSLDTMTTNNYTVYVDVTPVSSDADILTFGPNAFISGNDITWYAPGGSVLSALTPTYTVSPFATGSPASGAPVDFTTSPQTYTITAQDGTTQEYYVTADVAPEESTLIWNLTGSGAWDFNKLNWLGQTSNSLTPFFDGDNVIFNKTTGGTITIAPGLSPLSTTVSAASGTYSFSGSPITTGSLTKSGNGGLTLNSSNTYNGGTVINAGQLTMNVLVNGALGTGSVTLNGGTLRLERITATNPLIVNGGTLSSSNGFGCNWNGPLTLNSNLTVSGDGNSGTTTFNGIVSGVGGLTFTGPNALNPRLAVANTYIGPTSVTACTLRCDNKDSLGSGALIISSTGRVNLNYAGSKTVSSLMLGGVAQTIPGTYGSITSGATFQSDTFFAGTGTVTILPSANISVFGTNVIGSSVVISPVVANAATIAYTVPFGTNLATLAPTFDMSFGATCTQVSGATPSPNFSTGPVVYSVTSSDSLITNVYTVTVTVVPYILVNPVAVTAQSNFGTRPPIHSIDGSGMTPNNPVTVASTAATGNGDGTMWLSNNTKSTWITFDLGSVKTLSGFRLWNYNEVNLSNRSIRTAGIYVGTSMPAANGSYASGGPAWGTLAENFTFTQAPGAAGYAGEDYTFASPISGRYIQIYVTDGFAGSDAYTGISEIRFYEPTKAAIMASFGPGATIGPVSGGVANIAWTVPFGTDLASLSPEFTLSLGATCDRTSGAIPSPNFSTGPVVYTVTSSDTLSTTAYTVTVTTAPPSTAKVMSNVFFPGLGNARATDATATSFVLNVRNGTPVNPLSPTYSMSPLASGSPASGTPLNFSAAQTYRITPQDASFQDYTVAVAPYTGYAARVMDGSYAPPFAYWPLNEGTGFVAYDNSSGNNGSYSNPGVSYNVAGPEGENAVSFSGAAGVAMEIPRVAALSPDTSFSVEMWVKPAAVPLATSPQYVASNVLMAGNREGWYLVQDNGATFAAGQAFVVRMFNRNGANRACQLSAPIDTVRWYHLVLTYDSNTKIARFYEAGTTNETDQIGKATLPSYFGNTSTSPFTVGKRSDNALPWAGSAAHVAFYNRALTSAEVQYHYSATSGNYATWAVTNAGGQAANLDFNNDGVQNGVAYFMGATGIATNPGLNASNMITWPMSASFSGTYEVQTSPDLSAWTNVTPRPLPASGNLNYTLPTGLGKQFVRLLVNPTP